MTFWHPFWCFSSEVLSRCDSAVFLASNWFYCYYKPPKRRRSPARPYPVRCAASQHSDQFLVQGRVECGEEAGSKSGLSLTLSQCRNVATLFYADFQNHSALLHKCNYRERWDKTSWKRVKNPMDPGSLQTSQMPVELGLMLSQNVITCHTVFHQEHVLVGRCFCSPTHQEHVPIGTCSLQFYSWGVCFRQSYSIRVIFSSGTRSHHSYSTYSTRNM